MVVLQHLNGRAGGRGVETEADATGVDVGLGEGRLGEIRDGDAFKQEFAMDWRLLDKIVEFRRGGALIQRFERAVQGRALAVGTSSVSLRTMTGGSFKATGLVNPNRNSPCRAIPGQ